MENLIKALKDIRDEAGSHTVTINVPPYGFGKIWQLADNALKNVETEQANSLDQANCATCKNTLIVRNSRGEMSDCPVCNSPGK